MGVIVEILQIASSMVLYEGGLLSWRCNWNIFSSPFFLLFLCTVDRDLNEQLTWWLLLPLKRFSSGEFMYVGQSVQ